DVTGRRGGVGNRAHAGLAVRIEIRAIVGRSAETVGVLAVDDGIGHAAFIRRQAGDLPSAGDVAERAVLRFEERQLVGVVKDEALRAVEERGAAVDLQAAEEGRDRRLLQRRAVAVAENLAGVINALRERVGGAELEAAGEAALELELRRVINGRSA